MAEDKLDKVDELSQEQVFSMTEFFNSVTNGGFYNMLTPMLINSRLKDLTQFPQQADETKINDALKSPKDSEGILISYGQDFENRSSIYRKLIEYSANMLSWDMNYVCTNCEPDDYTSPSYQKDLDVIKRFFDTFDMKKEFQQVVYEMFRNEAAFYLFRLDNARPSLQELSPDPNWTMITGRNSDTLLFSFNMLYFLQPGVDVNFYPDFFRQKLNDFFVKNQGISQYDPALLGAERGTSSWVYYQDIPYSAPPWGWCWKLRPEIGARIPIFSSLWPDLVLQPLFRNLQKNINAAMAFKAISGEVPMLSNASAKVRDSFALSPDTLSKFLAYMKASLSDAVSAIAMPLNNLKIQEFSGGETEMYSSTNRNVLSMSGVNTNLLFTNPNRTSGIEANLSLQMDEMAVQRVYPQFSAFLNFFANRQTSKYKFKFLLEGTNSAPNRQARLDSAIQLSNMGMVLPQRIASAVGLSPFDFQRMLDESKSTKFVDKLTPITPAAQMPADNGRPQKKDSELGDSGERTRTAGSNLEKGGKV